MCNDQEKHYPRDLCLAMLRVWEYLKCDCSDAECPYTQLLLEVRRQREEEGKLEYQRQQEVINKKIEGDIE
jgi:hypothetical protein